MTTILITGGAGFIGSHTADALLEKGYKVRVLDCLDPQIHGPSREWPEYLDPRIERFVGDVRSREDVAGAIDGVEVIYHFAAQTGVGQSMYEIHGYSDVNINGTAMLLDVLANQPNRVRKLILSSSRAVYGEGLYFCKKCRGEKSPSMRTQEQLERAEWEVSCPDCGEHLAPVPTHESTAQNPISYYALTKRVQEEMVQMFSQIYGLECVILRYFNVYGLRQALNNPYTGIGAIFTNRALSGKDIPVYEDGQPGRDFVNVRDVVQANLLALDFAGQASEVFNVGSGQRLTVKALAEMIRDKIANDVQVTYTGQFRIGDIRDCYADISKSRSVLGFEPQVSFSEGVAELIEWARSQTFEDRSAQAVAELKSKKLMKGEQV